MAYLNLTTTAQIRAVLTVQEEDLDDEVIEGYGLEDDLSVALEASLPTWSAVTEAGGINATRLRLFAKYFCAGTVAKMAQAFVLKKSTDGSNEGQRSDADGWAWMAESLLADANKQMGAILDSLELSVPATPFSVIGVSTPDRDVITTPRS